MNFLITLIRIPPGIIGLIIVVAWWSLLFFIETAVLIVAFPLGVLFMSRNRLRESWMYSYPNSHPIQHIVEGSLVIFDWVTDD